MLRTPIFCLVAILLPILAVCQKKLNLDPSGLNTLHYVYQSDQSIVQSLPQGQDTIHQTMKLWYHFEIDEINDSTISLGLVYDDMFFEMVGKSFNYNSNSDTIYPPDSRVFGYKALLGINLKLTLNRQGAIKGIKGLEVARDKMLANLAKEINISGIQLNAIPLMNEIELISGLSQLFINFPEEQVTIGDSWSRSNSFNSDFNLTYDDTFTVSSLNERKDTVHISSAIYTPENGFFTSKNGLDIRLKFNGKQDGEFVLNAMNGFVQEATLTQTILGNADTIIENESLEWPITVQTQTKIIQVVPQ